MVNGRNKGAVAVAGADPLPLSALAEEAQAMMDDLNAQLASAKTDRERFFLCIAVSGIEQVAYALLTCEGGDGYHYQTPAEVSLSFFGRLVSAL